MNPLAAMVIATTSAAAVRRPGCWNKRQFGRIMSVANTSMAQRPMTRSTNTVTTASVFL